MGVLLCVSCDCGGAGDAELSVDLRTDYAPGIEFDIVRTRLDTGENEELGAVNTESSIAAFLGGQRVAEFADVDAGTRRVTVSLVRARDGETIASRDVVVAVEGSVAVTVMPVGRCLSRTAVSVRLRCCPPGPLAQKKVSSTSGASFSLRSLGDSPIP